MVCDSVTIDDYATKEIECDHCGVVSRVAAFIPLRQAWCPVCGSPKIRLYKPEIKNYQEADDERKARREIYR